MTEAQWPVCEDPKPMLELVRYRASERQVRLFAVACCRRVIAWTERADEIRGSVELADGSTEPFNRGDDYRNAVLVSELFADGEATEDSLNRAYWGADDNTFSQPYNAIFCGGDPFRDAAALDIECVALTYLRVQQTFCEFASPAPESTSWPEAERESARERVARAGLFRDIFGNPFRPIPFPPSWHTETALSLAVQMYGSRNFSAMPILADVLQEAGCDNDDILHHCRGPGPHARGCWVVDLVLGKE